MTLLKEILHIPERMHDGDFVLKLAEGMENRAADKTVRDYVVTSQLHQCIKRCLSLVQQAVAENRSKGAILHGSFGSGKSHLMAVLGLLLTNHAAVRRQTKLRKLIESNENWLLGKNYLVVPFNLIGAANLEHAIFGQYTRFMAQHHPHLPLPVLSKTDYLFQDAAKLRQSMGDDAFFAVLNQAEAAAKPSGWGNLAADWDGARFEAALQASPEDGLYTDLIGALVKTFFTSFGQGQQQGHDHYLGLEAGLEVMARHAHAAGFHGIILFLDELILWLAGKAGDGQFLSDQIPKLSRVVETQYGRRPIPIVSFVARQRDLADLVGDHLPGVENVRFDHMFTHWLDRFELITIEDKNLAEIVAKRVLQPKAGGAELLEAAFEAFKKKGARTMDALMMGKHNEADFRRLYPFSPALIEALVALSSTLQRERTCLKVLYQILIQGRDHLRVGDLVPMGDLYDAISEGVKAFSAKMQERFEDGKKLWEKKLKPMLLKKHGIEAGAPDGLETQKAFDNDARLAKTIVLAALVADAEVFRNFTANKLADYNYGTIKAFIAGTENRQALARVREWAAQVGEIKLSDTHNPVITVKLSGVDTEVIMRNAERQDNHGTRRNFFHAMLFQLMGVPENQTMPNADVPFIHTWRGTQRQVLLEFGNVRIMPEVKFLNQGPIWKLVVDYPFDASEATPMADLNRVETFKKDNPSQFTLVWLPTFFNHSCNADLGKLVILDYLLRNQEVFRKETPQLTEVDRNSAWNLLSNQQTALKQGLKNAILEAYGLEASENKPHLDPTYNFQPQVFSFHDQVSIQNLGAVNMEAAFGEIVDKALTQQYPGHPHFQVEIKKSTLVKLWEKLRQALYEENQRLFIQDKKLRTLLAGVLNPLKLAEMAENALIANQTHWLNLLTRASGGITGKTVADLRAGLDHHQNCGLPREVADLVIVAVAAMDRCGFHDGERLVPQAQVDGLMLEGYWVLQPQEIPSDEAWEEALHRAGVLFGIAVTGKVNLGLLNQFHGQVLEHLTQNVAAWEHGRRLLEETAEKLALNRESPRLQTARAVVRLVEKLRRAKPVALVVGLAELQPPTTLEAMARSMTQAKTLTQGLERADWDLIQVTWESFKAGTGPPEWGREALLRALAADEVEQALLPVIEKVRRAAVAAVRNQVGEQQEPKPSPLLTEPQRKSHTARGYQAARIALENNQSKTNLRVTFEWDEP